MYRKLHNRMALEGHLGTFRLGKGHEAVDERREDLLQRARVQIHRSACPGAGPKGHDHLHIQEAERDIRCET